MRVQYRNGGVFLPQLGLWLDPHERQTGPERVFVSHAHSDHTARHREVILSEPTSRLMRARLGGRRCEHVLGFGERRAFAGAEDDFQLTLLPAGHIFGSAMAWIEAGDESLLYTGDFKLRPGRSAEACDPTPARGCDRLIMETTFGRPQYQFPPTEDVMAAVIGFCRETLERGETPALLGYSLGKSQEVLSGLGDAGLPLMLHPHVQKLTHIYEQLGQRFPAYVPFDPGALRGKVLLCPPGALRAAAMCDAGPFRTVMLTGWAADPGCRYRYGVDAAFPLSDHADFNDLIAFVKQVRPGQVLTLHGFAADFAGTLRELGFEARALSEDEQLTLPLGAVTTALRESR